MPAPKAATTIRKTPNFDFIFGRYSHAGATIPYFQVSMSFSDAAHNLRLVNEMPGAASMNWRIEELFQRDIDWWRVERKIVPYLKQQAQPHFFNSLTIALLPIRGEAILPFGTEGEWAPPKLDEESRFSEGKISDYGPIRCGFWGSWNDPADDNARLGQLCWNTDQICAVAIDGQHRLAALKEITAPGGSQYHGSTVPVLLIVLSPELGFVGGQSRDEVIATLRRLFIDLNKHAEKPKRARQILLDDRDPASICVRTLVADQLEEGMEDLQGRPPRLPLSLVDWHSEQAKFDEGPYVATILGTDWIVAKVLGIKPFEDPIAFDQIELIIRRLEQKLEIKLTEARKRLDECRKYDRPFDFFIEEPVNELAAISNAFRQRWATPLIHLLTKLSPYSELITLRANHDTLRPEFANWYALREAADKAGQAGRARALFTNYERHIAQAIVRPIAPGDLADAVAAFTELKTSRELAFTVVFQRALVLAFLQLTKVTPAMLSGTTTLSKVDLEDLIDDGSEDEGENAAEPVKADFVEERARQLVEAVNCIIQRESAFVKVGFEYPIQGEKEHFDRFWLCSLQMPEGPIDFTQSASKRASDLILMAGLFWIRRTQLGSQSFEQLMEQIEAATTGIDLKLSQCFSRLSNGDGSVAWKILKSRDQDTEDETRRLDEIRSRAAWLWATLSK